MKTTTDRTAELRSLIAMKRAAARCNGDLMDIAYLLNELRAHLFRTMKAETGSIDLAFHSPEHQAAAAEAKAAWAFLKTKGFRPVLAC